MKYVVIAAVVLAAVSLATVLLRHHSVGNPYIAKITPQQRKALELATPGQIIEMYFRALNEKDLNLAMALLSEDMLRKYKEQDILAVMTSVTKVSDLQIRFDKQVSPDRIQFDVTYYQESEGRPSGTGKVNRFLDLVRSSPDGQWRIDAFATSP